MVRTCASRWSTLAYFGRDYSLILLVLSMHLIRIIPLLGHCFATFDLHMYWTLTLSTTYLHNDDTCSWANPHPTLYTTRFWAWIALPGLPSNHLAGPTTYYHILMGIPALCPFAVNISVRPGLELLSRNRYGFLRLLRCISRAWSKHIATCKLCNWEVLEGFRERRARAGGRTSSDLGFVKPFQHLCYIVYLEVL